MQPIILQGRPSFSKFRLSALQSALNATTPDLNISSVDALDVYFIEAKKPLKGAAKERSIALLNAEQTTINSGGFFVTPRKGTISPWSTKATDIFLNCSIEGVVRVERGIHYRIVDSNGLELTIANLGAALYALHDRMTEAVYADVSDFFTHFQPARIRTVPLMDEGPEAFHRANI